MVIAVIAILAALLVPALVQVKVAAHRTECLNIMRQWDLGFVSYAEDNDDIIPREGYWPNGKVYRDTWSEVADASSQDVWYNVLSVSYIGNFPAASYAAPIKRHGFYERNSFFHCPSAPLPPETKSPGYSSVIFSIAMNSQLIEIPNVPNFSVNQITHPHQTVLFLDNLLEEEKRVDEEQFRNNLGQPSSDATRFAGVRHGRAGNLAFADGHAESMPGTKVVQTHGPNEGGVIYPEVDVRWNPVDK